ncbi:MAG: hypothetical protein ABIU95_02700 [Burkholderiales bacterium]
MPWLHHQCLADNAAQPPAQHRRTQSRAPVSRRLGGKAMMEVEVEGDWMVSLEQQRKLIFLSTLAHELTIAGRNSYTVGGEGLDKPSQLREINETQHRVLACLREIVNAKSSENFQRSIAGYVLQKSDPALQALMSYTWRVAKERV